jgi:hypothetical protein
MTPPKISIIICSIEAAKFARVSECYRNLLANIPFEIIGIHDAQSLSEGYNRGIARAKGEILILSHDDVLIVDPEFTKKIMERLKTYDLLGFAGAGRLVNATWFGAGQPYLHGAVCHALARSRTLGLNIWGGAQWPVASDIKVMDGLCMITRTEVARAVGFDAETFNGFHLYDIDFSFSTYLAGYKLGICCDIPIIHESGGRFDHVHKEFALRFIDKHHANLDQVDEEKRRLGSNIANQIPVGRSADFTDIAAVRRAWCKEVFARVTNALNRPIRQMESVPPAMPQGTTPGWWEKYLAP